MTKNIDPLGTVLYLQEGNEKIMIIGRGVVFNDQETNEEVYTDYMGCIYPSGVNPENAIFFNQENIALLKIDNPVIAQTLAAMANKEVNQAKVAKYLDELIEANLIEINKQDIYIYHID